VKTHDKPTRHIVIVGKARRHTQAIDLQPNPELVGGRTQFSGG